MSYIIHIAGSTGSGKTTLGEKIEKKFRKIIIKDLDDFNDLIQEKNEFKKLKTVKNKKIYWYKKFKLLLNSFIKKFSNKIIIFVGYNSNWGAFVNIPSNNKYFIDLPISQIIQQKISRDKLKTKINTNKIVQWIKTIELDIKEYSSHKYKFLSSDNIYKKICDIIDNF